MSVSVRMSDPQELELHTAVNCHVGALPLEKRLVLLTSEPSFQPPAPFYVFCKCKNKHPYLPISSLQLLAISIWLVIHIYPNYRAPLGMTSSRPLA